MAWGKEWITPAFTPKPEWLDDIKEFPALVIKTDTELEQLRQHDLTITGIDLGSKPSQSFIGTRELKTQGSNLVDDQAYLYFQCNKCLDIFDPETKSFATLNQKRYDVGWKVIWNLDGMGYKVYCVKCGEE